MSDENVNPFNLFKVGDEVDVKIIDIDLESKRISISMRALLQNDEAEEAADEDAE